tara:strand:- start:428 stop:982 length:555 start_codon:yes stop_codon:yes gene_type:complete
MEILPAEGPFIAVFDRLRAAAASDNTAGYAFDLLQRLSDEVRLLYINRPLPTRLGELVLQADTLALLLEATGRSGGNDEQGDEQYDEHEQNDEQGDEQYDENEQNDEQNDEHEPRYEQNDEHEPSYEQNDEDEGDWDFSRPIRHCPAPRRDLAGNWANLPHLPGVMVRRSHRIYIQDGNDTNLP